MTQAAQLAQYGASSVGLAFKNRIINGAMVIDQRNAGASVTGGFPIDRWATFQTPASKFSFQQNAGSVTPPSGFTNYLGATVTSAYTPSASDILIMYQWLEGYTVADFGFGSSGALTITLSFWVRSSITGLHSGSVVNGAQNRAYPFSFTISSANTWEYKTVTIAGDTSGTWLKDNGNGMAIVFNLGCGSNYLATAGAWTGSTRYGVTGSQSIVGTNGATFYITGAQLEIGSTATSFDTRPYGTELNLCLRYFSKITNVPYTGVFCGIMYNTVLFLGPYQYNVPMRAAPTLSYSALGDFALIASSNGITPTSIGFDSATSICARVQIVIGTALTAGDGAYLQSQNSSAWLALNAEL